MMTGWIDTSSAAAAAVELVSKEASAVKIIDFDIDTFVDFRARRRRHRRALGERARDGRTRHARQCCDFPERYSHVRFSPFLGRLVTVIPSPVVWIFYRDDTS